jgi:multicomponent Na+:H+ antiporter subunit E
MVATIIRILILTVFWAALQGSFSLADLLLGAVLGTAVVFFSRPLYDTDEASDEMTLGGGLRPLRRMGRFVILVLVFLRELTVSSVRVARYVLQPTLQIRSGIVAYPLDVTTDREIAALANLITLTPGTMSLDVSEDKSTLYIHTMSVASESGQDVIEDIQTSLELHVRRALGPKDAA